MYEGPDCLWKKKASWPLPANAGYQPPTNANPKKAKVFRGSLPPHPAADHFINGLLKHLLYSSIQPASAVEWLSGVPGTGDRPEWGRHAVPNFNSGS